MRIKVLPDNIANQIAAGEVVERPASVVKELIENSLDAGASIIEIHIEKGGLQLISIRDDGSGMDKQDLPLAIAQHATSKIRILDDLTHIGSLGFRGEALASIASVSQLSIVSKPRGAEQAWQLTSDAELLPAAHEEGTSINIVNLFANVPVRRKFLKSVRTEFNQIESVVKRAALSAYPVAFKLIHNDKILWQVLPLNNAEQYPQRLSKIIGKVFAEQCLAIDESRAGMRLWGWVLPEQHSRAHADWQYMFVNGRMVKDKLLNHAIRVAFTEVYQQGRYPAYVLYLECPAENVDVNVHPTKHEVRFVEQRLVHDFVQASLARGTKPSSAEPVYYSAPNTEVVAHSIAEPTQAYRPSVSKLSYKALVAIDNQFILTQVDEQIWVLHYARACRWFAEQALANGQLTPQPLLIPTQCCLSTREMELCLQQAALWLEFGIDIRQMSPSNVVIRSLPAFLMGSEASPLIQALLKCTTQADITLCLAKHAFVGSNLSLEAQQQCLKQLALFTREEAEQAGVLQACSADKVEAWFT
jgi:DNA mismatch repair protein MutL